MQMQCVDASNALRGIFFYVIVITNFGFIIFTLRQRPKPCCYTGRHTKLGLNLIGRRVFSLFHGYQCVPGFSMIPFHLLFIAINLFFAFRGHLKVFQIISVF